MRRRRGVVQSVQAGALEPNSTCSAPSCLLPCYSRGLGSLEPGNGTANATRFLMTQLPVPLRLPPPPRGPLLLEVANNARGTRKQSPRPPRLLPPYEGRSSFTSPKGTRKLCARPRHWRGSRWPRVLCTSLPQPQPLQGLVPLPRGAPGVCSPWCVPSLVCGNPGVCYPWRVVPLTEAFPRAWCP